MLPFTRIPFVGRPSHIVAGSASYTSPGTYYFTVPDHHSITFDIRGGGGGGGGMGYNTNYPVYAGGSGGTSYVAGAGSTSYAIGGGGGGVGYVMGSGATDGSDGSYGYGTGSGTSYSGGGASGGGRAVWSYSPVVRYSGYGGPGGRMVWIAPRGVIAPKTVLTIVVGAGGYQGNVNMPSGFDYTSPYPSAGGSGAVYISWS